MDRSKNVETAKNPNSLRSRAKQSERFQVFYLLDVSRLMVFCNNIDDTFFISHTGSVNIFRLRTEIWLQKTMQGDVKSESLA